MLNFNSLFQNDISSWRSGSGRSHHQHWNTPAAANAPLSSITSGDLQQALSHAYDRLHSTVQSQLQPVNASTDAAAPQPDVQDYAPQAVADRIVGFITDRLNQARADGASQQKLQALYRQALKGVEQGLKTAKHILQTQGVYTGDTQNNFYQTVNLLADDLQKLGQSLFGGSLGQDSGGTSATVTPITTAANSSDTATTPATSDTSAPAVTDVQIAASRTRSFQLQVVTKEGDKVTIEVNAAQLLSAQTSGNGSVSALSATQASANHLSFSVQGNLNADELKSLNDLFQQVNTVASTFYGGDVQKAFDQASQVGADARQIASFAVNIQQTQTVVVQSTYANVQNAAAQPAPANAGDSQTPYQSLGNFAGQLQQAGTNVSGQDSGIANTQSLLAQLVALLYDGKSGQQDNSKAFKQFTHHVLS